MKPQPPETNTLRGMRIPFQKLTGQRASACFPGAMGTMSYRDPKVFYQCFHRYRNCNDQTYLAPAGNPTGQG
jgi:hypothetical protein